jgi:DNA-binding response OmpR family regulator
MARILVVDDERLVAQAMGEVLTSAGHDVIYAGLDSDPSDAVLAEAYDLLLTDIFLPETSGWDLIRAVRQTRPDTAIVAVSGGNVGVTPELALKISALVGAGEILTKPANADDLLRAVDAALQRKR